jgi:hypothetical protein
VVFRADAAFAKPEIYEALEERGVKYAIRRMEDRRECSDEKSFHTVANRRDGCTMALFLKPKRKFRLTTIMFCGTRRPRF